MGKGNLAVLCSIGWLCKQYLSGRMMSDEGMSLMPSSPAQQMPTITKSTACRLYECTHRIDPGICTGLGMPHLHMTCPSYGPGLQEHNLGAQAFGAYTYQQGMLACRQSRSVSCVKFKFWHAYQLQLDAVQACVREWSGTWRLQRQEKGWSNPCKLSTQLLSMSSKSFAVLQM